MKRVYAMYDKAVSAYAMPFFARTDAEASRMFVLGMSAEPTVLAHCHDYSLCYLSEFNEITGEFGVPEAERLVVPKIVMPGTVAAALVREMVPAGTPVPANDEEPVAAS